MRILQIKKFLPDTLCDNIIAYRTMVNVSSKGANPYYQSKSLPIKLISDRKIAALVQEIKYTMMYNLRSEYIISDIYPDFSDVVKLSEGDKLDLHADNAYYPSGKPNYVNHRTFTAMVYLNDDYEGGDLYFADGSTIRPEKGMAVGFPAGIEFAHGMREVKWGNRYTVAIWYTDNPTHIEI